MLRTAARWGIWHQSPLIIEAGNDLISGSLYAMPDTTADADWSKLKITATSKGLKHDTGTFGKVTLGVKPKFIIVDDIGLNGVQICEKENERPIFFRAANWVQDQDKLIHAALSSARSEHDSATLQTSFPC